MGLKLVVEEVQRINEYIWQASLSPSDARVLGDCQSNYGPYTIVLIAGAAIEYDEQSRKISFNSNSARLLNVGNTERLIIMSDISQATSQNSNSALPKHEKAMRTESNGDNKFLNELPEELQNIGNKLLAKVRNHFRGELKYYPRSGKYVESPDNFWTVKIQPRDKSLRITVRGTPTSFHKTSKIDIKADMGSYSAFKVSYEEQIEEAFTIIRLASQK